MQKSARCKMACTAVPGRSDPQDKSRSGLDAVGRKLLGKLRLQRTALRYGAARANKRESRREKPREDAWKSTMSIRHAGAR